MNHTSDVSFDEMSMSMNRPLRVRSTPTKNRSSSSRNTRTSSVAGVPSWCRHTSCGRIGIVGAHVEARAGVVGPRESVRDVVDDVGKIRAGREIAEAQAVPLAAVEVDGVREHRVIGGDLEATEGEVLVPDREDVLVEEDLRGLGALAARPATVDRVLRALLGPGGVLPRTFGDGCGLVGLLDPRLDLVEDPFAQPRQGRELGVGVAVLGLEVGDHLGIVPVAEPIPVVDAGIAVFAQDVGPAPGRGQAAAITVLLDSRHCRLSLNGAECRAATATISPACRP